MRRGISIVVSAPSGAGKSTLVGKLLAEFPQIGYSVSCTTRARRPGEEDGKDYFFVSESDFEKMRLAGEFAEWAKVHGNYYGTPLDPVRSMQAEGRDVLFDVDVQGAAKLRGTLPDATFIFILPPSMEELKKRMEKRGTDDEKTIAMRLANAAAELRESFWYGSLIINADLEQAYRDLAAVYRAATLAPAPNKEILTRLLEEAEKFHGHSHHRP